MTPQQEAQIVKFRMIALYHNCLSAAAFKRMDAVETDTESESEALCLRREAAAYEQVAGWLNIPVAQLKTRMEVST
jgi:hypothetical protein